MKKKLTLAAILLLLGVAIGLVVAGHILIQLLSKPIAPW